MKIEKLIIKEDVYDITVKDNHNFYANNILVSNCGEIPLSELDSCRLLVVNLYSFIKEPFTTHAEVDWVRFDEAVNIAQRLMDDIIDLEEEKINQIISKIKADPESDEVKHRELIMWEKILDNTLKGRRTGLGMTGWGDALAALNIGYGSYESMIKVHDIAKFFKHSAYKSSIEMAKAIGPFPIYNAEKEMNNPYIKRLNDEDPALVEEMRLYGRRNIALLTMAPTGSVSNYKWY